VLVFFGELSRVLLQGHELLRLGARYWLGAPNSWDTTGCPQVLAVVLESLYTRFLSGPSDDPTSIHKYGNPDGSKDHLHISPSTAIIGLLKMKKEIIIFNSIKIISYEIKLLNKHTTKCWACACQQITPLGSAHVQET
jgi:hypothetical protein